MNGIKLMLQSMTFFSFTPIQRSSSLFPENFNGRELSSQPTDPTDFRDVAESIESLAMTLEKSSQELNEQLVVVTELHNLFNQLESELDNFISTKS